MKKIGIVGASGLIGYGLYEYFRLKGIAVVGTYYSHPRPGMVRLDLASDGFECFSGCTHLILSGGYTNINMVYENRELSEKVNVIRTIELLQWCLRQGIKPIMLSSDQIFDGRKGGGYREEDETQPANVYGAQKLVVERFMAKEFTHYIIARLSKTYTRCEGFGGMYRDIVARLKSRRTAPCAFDQIFNPTDVGFVAKALDTIIDFDGLVNVADEHVMSRYAFGLMIADELHLDRSLVVPIEINSLRFAEPKTLDTSLDTTKLRTLLATRGTT